MPHAKRQPPKTTNAFRIANNAKMKFHNPNASKAHSVAPNAPSPAFGRDGASSSTSSYKQTS